MKDIRQAGVSDRLWLCLIRPTYRMLRVFVDRSYKHPKKRSTKHTNYTNYTKVGEFDFEATPKTLVYRCATTS